MIPRCPICFMPTLARFLTRLSVPVHQNLLFETAEGAVRCPRGDLDLVVCQTCGYIFNQAFDQSLLRYGDHYKNPQGDSPTYQAYMDSLVSHFLEDKDLRGDAILEIGCGDGSFLRRLVEADQDTTGVGYDPSYTGPDNDLGGRLRFRRQFYNTAGAVRRHGDWVICRHVIEHVADPWSLLLLIRWTVDAQPDARVFLETPTVEWILRNRVSWDLFYEHRSYFSEASLGTACEMVGLRVRAVETRFGGQYLWVEAALDGVPPISYTRSDLPERALDFAKSDPDRIVGIKQKVLALNKQGTVAIWGAAAKGVTLANLIDPDRRLVSCVVDLSPNKQGHFLPGTGHPIVPPETLAARGVRAVLLTNPIYYAEIATIINRLGSPVELVNPLDS